MSWGIGLVFGIVLALISYFWYYAAVTIAVGVLGYLLGAGLVAYPGGRRDPAVHRRSGRRCHLRGRCVRAGIPRDPGHRGQRREWRGRGREWVLLALGTIKLDALDDGVFGSLLRYNWLTAIAVAVIAIAAVFYQTRDVAKMASTMPTQSDYRY